MIWMKNTQRMSKDVLKNRQTVIKQIVKSKRTNFMLHGDMANEFNKAKMRMKNMMNH